MLGTIHLGSRRVKYKHPFISWYKIILRRQIFKGKKVNISHCMLSPVQSLGHVQMWELDYKESWAPKNWCFWTVGLAKTLESPLDSKEIQPVHPQGDQFWVFTGRIDVEAETPTLWPPDVKSWLIWKDPDAGKDWRQEEKGMTEEEMDGCHHWPNGHGCEWTPAVGDGQGGLACCVIHEVTKSQTQRSDWTELNWMCL